MIGDPYRPKSRSRETTFQRDLADWTQVRTEVVRLAGQVADDVAAEQRDAVRVVVKVRWVPFDTAGTMLTFETERDLVARAAARLDDALPGSAAAEAAT